MQANNGKCRLTASKPFGDVMFLSFALKKGQHYNNDFSKGYIILSLVRSCLYLLNFYFYSLTRLRESGLLTFWFNQITPNVDKCLITNNNVAKVNDSKWRSLNLDHASSIFLFLIVGLVFSFFGFLGELTIHYLKK
jgi:hypothetical protein